MVNTKALNKIILRSFQAAPETQRHSSKWIEQGSPSKYRIQTLGVVDAL